jgi:hypothetical protein
MSLFSRKFIRFSSVLAFLLFLFIPAVCQDLPAEPASKLLPEKLGDFRAFGSLASSELPEAETQRRPGINSWATRDYVSKDGQRFRVMVNTTVSDSRAYAELTEKRSSETSGKQAVINDTGIGTASFSYSDGKRNHLCFFKGRVSACLEENGAEARDIRMLMNLAKTLADPIDKGTGEIPVLVKHLPDWQSVESRVLYAVDRDSLKNSFSNQPVLDAVSFDGGAEAVIADYDTKRLAIVEFNTASLATDNNQHITAELQELRAQGQSVPSAYRRVGNYAVFVFDAPSQEAANQLIDQVKYQQVVQWLGENPFSYEKATREFTETTLGVFVSVVKASALALAGCLAVGGFFGAMLFSLRRAQQRAKEAYSDSDAMLRLNLDELTPESDPARLLGRGH